MCPPPPWQVFGIAENTETFSGERSYTSSSCRLPFVKRDYLLTGRTGEEAAEEYLRRRSYAILGRNVRTWRGEIDLIARKGESIIFIEVKARARDDGWQPSERVDREKMKNLKRAAAIWLGKEKKENVPARIDIVGVCEGRVIEHFEDVTA